MQEDNDDNRNDLQLRNHRLQTGAGVHNETLFSAQDQLLAEAANNGIHVTLALKSDWQVLDGTVQVRDCFLRQLWGSTTGFIYI